QNESISLYKFKNTFIMEVLIGIILLIAFILIIRLFGAWMLRIDEIIKLQKEMLVEMKKHTQQNLS
ncbi:MAG: hypothetical protein RL656_1538, partial [Bacteroidota bacterium]